MHFFIFVVDDFHCHWRKPINVKVESFPWQSSLINMQRKYLMLIMVNFILPQLTFIKWFNIQVSFNTDLFSFLFQMAKYQIFSVMFLFYFIFFYFKLNIKLCYWLFDSKNRKYIYLLFCVLIYFTLEKLN